MRALKEGRRCGLTFCPCTEHSLFVVVGNICKLLPPGPIHRVFESLRRNSNGQSLYKCKQWTTFLSLSSLSMGGAVQEVQEGECESCLHPAQLRSFPICRATRATILPQSPCTSRPSSPFIFSLLLATNKRNMLLYSANKVLPREQNTELMALK